MKLELNSNQSAQMWRLERLKKLIHEFETEFAVYETENADRSKSDQIGLAADATRMVRKTLISLS